MDRFLTLIILIIYALCGTSPGSAEEVKALRMIIVQDKQEAQTIHQHLRQGASFSGLAGTHSIGPERRTWGYSGTLRLDDVQPELREALRQLKPGQSSGVLEVGQTFVLLKVISPKIEQHYEAAERAYREGKTDQAIGALTDALRLEADSVQTHLKLARVYEATRRYEEAIAHMEKAQGYAPRVSQVAILRGTVYMRAAIEQQNRTYGQKALQAYDLVTKLDEHLAPAVHFGKGKIYLLVLKQPEKALSHLEKAVEISPKVPEVYQLLIQANYDTQQYQKAWQHLRMAQSLGFDFPNLREALYKVKSRHQP